MTAKEDDNVRNSYLAIKATQRQSCEEEDMAKAFQLGLALGLEEKHNEMDKTLQQEPCDIQKLKAGDTVLVKCKVEAVFTNSQMVMVTTRDCDKGFDAYRDEVVCVRQDNIKQIKREPCDDCISRQAVLEQINCWIGSGEYKYTNATYYLTKRMQDLSPVSPKPKIGRWARELIRNEYGGCIGAKMICSECGQDNGYDKRMKFCPNCGCKMQEETEVKKMQIDSKSPCGTCEKLSKCKMENKDNVRECGAYKPSEFFDMIGMSIEEKVDSFSRTIKFLNKRKAEDGDKE